MKKLTELEVLTLLHKALYGDKRAARRIRALIDSPAVRKKLKQLK